MIPAPPDPVRAVPRRGRSTLVDMRDTAAPRRRPWGLRRAIVLTVLALCALVAWTVATEALPHDGPGRALYLLHDILWVPFRAIVWVRSGVWSLLWLLPAGLLLLVVAIEFLGLMQVLRRLQTTILRVLIRRGAGRVVISAQQLLGWRRGHEGFLVGLIGADLRVAEARAMAAVEAGTSHDPAMLARLATYLAYLRAADPRAQLRCAEALLLAGLLEPHDTAVGLRDRLRRIWGDAPADRIDRLSHADATTLLQAADQMAQTALPPDELGLLTLSACRLAAGAADADRGDADGGDAGAAAARHWFSRWACLQTVPARPRPDLSAAEQGIAFEFWAATSERALARAEITGDRAGWLAQLLPGVAMRRPLGELAAIGGPDAGGAP